MCDALTSYAHRFNPSALEKLGRLSETMKKAGLWEWTARCIPKGGPGGDAWMVGLPGSEWADFSIELHDDGLYWIMQDGRPVLSGAPLKK